MNNARTLLLGLLVSSLALPACARVHRVYPQADAKKGEFVYYALPRTVAIATFTATVSEVKKTPSCASRTDLMQELGLKQSPYEGKIFNITKTELSKRSEADPNQVYAVKLNGLGTRSLGLEMSATGVPSAGSSKAEDVVIPAVVGAAQAAADIVAPFLGAGTQQQVAAAPAFDACDAASNKLKNLRKRLLDLHSSQGAEDPKEVLEYKAAKLTAQLKKLEGAFTGVVPGKSTKIVCEYTPTRDEDESTLLTWSMVDGLIDPPATCIVPSGLETDKKATLSSAAPGNPPARSNPEPLPAEACKDNPQRQSAPTEWLAKCSRARLNAALTDEHAVSIRLQALNGDVSATVPPTRGKKDQRSFFYRRPAATRVWVEDKRTSKAKPARTSKMKDWAVAQRGTVHSLPRVWSAGKVEVSVAFDPETGALTKLEMSRTAADLSGAVETGREIGGQLRNAEITELERKKTLRELKEALEDNDEDLNPPEDTDLNP